MDQLKALPSTGVPCALAVEFHAGALGELGKNSEASEVGSVFGRLGDCVANVLKRVIASFMTSWRLITILSELRTGNIARASCSKKQS